MYCPKCGAKNPENAKFCEQCGTKLHVTLEDTETSTIAESVSVKRRTSRLAISAFITAILGVLIIPLGWVAIINLAMKTQEGNLSRAHNFTLLLSTAVLLGILLAFIGFILGIVAKTKIKRKPNELKGNGLANVAIITGSIPISWGILGALIITIWAVIDSVKSGKRRK